MLLSVPCSSEPEYPPLGGDVKVYFYTPIEAYEKIGTVSTQGSTEEPPCYLITDLQQRAYSIGANGILVHSPSTEGEIAKGTGFIKLTATAIRIK
jgi:hypothetical protein